MTGPLEIGLIGVVQDGLRADITTANHAWCWGENAEGELGEGTATTTNQLVPAPVVGPM